MTVDFNEWLSSQDAVRCIIVDADVNSSGSEVTRYLSTAAYSTASTVYNPIINADSIQFIERLSINGNTSVSFGDIEISNLDGTLDVWLDDVWSNRAVLVRIGDVRWDLADFVTIMDGVVEDIDSKDETVLNLKIRDKLQRLNASMSEVVLGGSTLNKSELIPLTFGECFNVTPLLSNPATLEYKLHDGIIEDIIEVRDNGVPVSFTKFLSTGRFTLAATPAGKITCSVQGDKNGTYRNSCGYLVERIVTDWAGPKAFSSGDIDAVNLAAFKTANPQPLGVYIKSRENALSMVEEIAASVGAQLAMSRAGQMRLIKIELPAPGTPFEIDSDDIVGDSFRINSKLEVLPAHKLGFCKNWTVESDLQTGIPASHKDLYAKEWMTAVAVDNTIKTLYGLTSEPEQVDTLMLVESDATAEATRLLDLWKNPRFIFEFTGSSKLIQLELGQSVNITYPRFGCDSGKEGMVIGLSIDWNDMTVKVEVLV